MIDPSSPIIDLYSSDAPIDPNGKHLPWLWILLLPFVDEKRIVSAFNENKSGLTVEECRRNAFGVSIMFLHLNHKLAVEAKSSIRYRPLEETDADVLKALSKDNDAHDMPYVIENENEESSADASDSKGDATTDTPAPAALADIMVFDHPVGDGISGTLSAPPQKWFTLAGPSCTVTAPPTPAPYAFHDLAGNKVIIWTFASPEEVPGSHKSELLPGVILEKSELTNFDLAPRRPPRLNRGGFNIVDLALGIRRGPNPNNILSYNGNGRGGDGQGHNPNQRQYNQGSQPQQFLQHFQNQQQQYSNNNNNNNYNRSYGYEMAHRNGDGRSGHYGGGRDDGSVNRNQYNDNGRNNNQNNYNNDSNRDQQSYNNGTRPYNNQSNYHNQNQNQNHQQQNSGGNYSHQSYAPHNNQQQYQHGNAYSAQAYPPQQSNAGNGRFSFSTNAGSNSGSSSAISAVSMDSMRAQLAKTLQQQGGRGPPPPGPGPGSFSSMGRPDYGSQGQGQNQGQYGGRR